MDNLPLFDLQSSERASIELSSSDYCILILFSSRDLVLAKDLSKEPKSPNWKVIGVYIGTEILKIKQWIKKEMIRTPIYLGGEDITEWQPKNVEETPWIIVIKETDIILSIKATGIGKPFIENVKRMVGSCSPDNKISLISSNNPSIDSLALRLEELEKQCRSDQEEIAFLKQEVETKDKLIQEVLEKLNEVQNKVKVRRPPINPPNSSLSNVYENPYDVEDQEYWKSAEAEHKQKDSSWMSSKSYYSREKTPSSITSLGHFNHAYSLPPNSVSMTSERYKLPSINGSPRKF